MIGWASMVKLVWDGAQEVSTQLPVKSLPWHVQEMLVGGKTRLFRWIARKIGYEYGVWRTIQKMAGRSTANLYIQALKAEDIYEDFEYRVIHESLVEPCSLSKPSQKKYRLLEW